PAVEDVGVVAAGDRGDFGFRRAWGETVPGATDALELGCGQTRHLDHPTPERQAERDRQQRRHHQTRRHLTGHAALSPSSAPKAPPTGSPRSISTSSTSGSRLAGGAPAFTPA